MGKGYEKIVHRKINAKGFLENETYCTKFPLERVMAILHPASLWAAVFPTTAFAHFLCQ